MARGAFREDKEDNSRQRFEAKWRHPLSDGGRAGMGDPFFCSVRISQIFLTPVTTSPRTRWGRPEDAKRSHARWEGGREGGGRSRVLRTGEGCFEALWMGEEKMAERKRLRHGGLAATPPLFVHPWRRAARARIFCCSEIRENEGGSAFSLFPPPPLRLCRLPGAEGGEGGRPRFDSCPW